VLEELDLSTLSDPSRWKIPMPAGGLPEGIEPDVVVWVDVSKVEDAWPRNYLYIEAGGEGRSQQPYRYHRFGEWIRGGETIEMSSICACDGEIGFTDGRHRFAWLRDHGVKRLPIAVCRACAEEVERRFGRSPSYPRF